MFVEPAEIRFMHRNEDSAFFTRVVEKFNQEYPEITVTLVPMDNVNLDQLDVTKPDCLIASMFELGSQSVVAEKFISLDGFIEQDQVFDKEDFYPGPLALVSWEGQTWAIPAGVNLVVMYFNKDLFDRAGASYPKPGWTWDDFLQAAIAIRNPEGNIWGFVPLIDVVDPLMFIFQHGGNIVDDIQNPTRTTFNDPLTVEAMEWYVNLFQGYKVAPTRRDVGSGGAIYRLVFGGNVGMWSGSFDMRGGEWTENDFDLPFQLGMAPLPSNTIAATYGEVEVYAIASQSQYPDACWRWISFVSGQTNEAYRMVPARRSVVESKEYELIAGSEVAGAARAAIEDAIIPPSLDQFASFAPGLEAFGQGIQRAVNGELTVQEAMDWAQQQSEK
jgi:multiple sugar transport system substrate-binding protein